MGSYTGTVPSFLAGELPDADKFLEITNFMTAATAAWTGYTPTWTASAGSPSIGNGTLTGRYRRLGKTVDFQILLIGGSTSNYGTAGAYWSFTLPFGPTSAAFAWTGKLLDSGTQDYTVIAATGTNGTASSVVELFRSAGASVVQGRHFNNTTFTFTTNDALWVSGTYELA